MKLSRPSLLLLALTLPAAAQSSTRVDVYWADFWHAAFHRLHDANADGDYTDDGEVTVFIDPATTYQDRVTTLQVRQEEGRAAAY